MSSSATTSLSFRPWSNDSVENVDLKNVLQRVNLERGHFRDITETTLQEEIAAEGGLVLSESENDDDDEEGGGEDDEERRPASSQTATKRSPTTREELYKAKTEMLQHVFAAEQDILMSLDFVSLLESKYEAGRAASTISPVLKTSVPTGSFAADIWHRMPADPAREAQEELLATNVRLAGLQQSADDLLAAATRLRDNVRRETIYWDQILSISERGWNVLRLPRQSHLLGAHFGFSGSTSVVGKRDVAALLTDADGNVNLERGLGTQPKAIRAVIRRGDKIVGSSVVPTMPGEDETTLESRIRFARDSVFDEELYHEMLREARLLGAMGITTQRSAINFKPTVDGDETDIEVSLELVSTTDRKAFGSVFSHENDTLAQSVALATRLLLGQAHREKLRERTQLPPILKDRKDDRAVLQVLRPLVSAMRHFYTLAHLNSHLDRISKLLSMAEVQLTTTHASMAIPVDSQIPTLEDLVRVFMESLTASAALRIKSPKGDLVELKVDLETSPSYNFGTVFNLSLPPQTPHRFVSVKDLEEGIDGLLTSALGTMIRPIIGSRWDCNEKDGLLRKPMRIGEDNLFIRTIVDSARGTLILRSGAEELVWSLEKGANESYWNAVKKRAT